MERITYSAVENDDGDVSITFSIKFVRKSRSADDLPAAVRLALRRLVDKQESVTDALHVLLCVAERMDC